MEIRKIRGRLSEDDKVEIPSDFEVDTTELQWGQPGKWRRYLPRGRYVVSFYINRSELRLSEADWNAEGKLIHNSAKNGFIVRGKGIAILMARFRVGTPHQSKYP